MVIPGFIDTERRYAEWYPELKETPPGAPEKLKEIPLRRLGRSEDIADACVFLASDASSYVTGDTIRVMGGRVIGVISQRGLGSPRLRGPHVQRGFEGPDCGAPMSRGGLGETMTTIGVLHPGEMGSGVGASARAAGARVLWVSEGPGRRDAKARGGGRPRGRGHARAPHA